MEAICLHVQAVLEDWMGLQRWQQRHAAHGDDAPCECGPEPIQRAQNLVINVPPGTSKSRIVAVCAVAWMWTRWPSWRVNCLSSNPRVAERDGEYCLTLVQSEWYRDTFRPAWKLRPQQCCKTHFATTARGFRKGFGWNSRITGDRADCLVFDDPHDAEEANSDLIREGVLSRFDNAISNRVNDLRSSVRIGVMQRVHEGDWTGHVLRQFGWDHLCIPMEWEPERVGAKADGIPRRTAIGWSDPRSAPGELMDPVRFPDSVLAQERRKGTYRYAGQYQQRPAPADGSIFLRGWWRFYTVLPELEEVIQSWDMSFTDSARSAYVVGQVWGRKGADKYLLDQVRDRMGFTAACGAVVALSAKWPQACAKLIEAKANGPAIIDALKAKIAGLIAVEPDGSKEARAHAVSPEVEAGNVYLPEDAEFTSDFLDEVTRFPNGVFKDQVDTFTQAVRRFALHREPNTVTRKQRHAGPRFS